MLLLLVRLCGAADCVAVDAVGVVVRGGVRLRLVLLVRWSGLCVLVAVREVILAVVVCREVGGLLVMVVVVGLRCRVGRS